MPKEMIHDIKVINAIVGQFGWTEDYAKAMHNWKQTGFTPEPDHPKLRSYTQRRFSHLMKLSMISSIDRGSDLMLTVDDFNHAMFWLLEAEERMPMIFRQGLVSIDSQIMMKSITLSSPQGMVEPANNALCTSHESALRPIAYCRL